MNRNCRRKTEKVYVKVNSDFDATGYMQPRQITWGDGRTYPIEQVRDFRPANTIADITNPALTVRRITLNANKVTPDEGIYQVDFFTDTKKLEKEKKLQQAMLGIKNKYGKNAVLKASSYEEGATMRQRNAQIGGHRAGGSDGKLQK